MNRRWNGVVDTSDACLGNLMSAGGLVMVLDTETTDADDDRELLELAWAFPQDQTCGHPPVHVQRFGHTRPIAPGAMAAHHIIPDDVSGLTLWRQPGGGEFADVFSEVEYIAGHNVDFDWETLGRPDVRRICTMSMARELWPNLERNDLATVLYSLLPPGQVRPMAKSAHSAGADVEMAYVVLQLCVGTARARGLLAPMADHVNTEWDAIWRLSESMRIPSRCPFNAHKGLHWRAVPRGFRTWCLDKLDDMDMYTRIAIEESLKPEVIDTP